MGNKNNVFEIIETKSNKIVLSEEDFKRFTDNYNLPIFVEKIKMKKFNGEAKFTIFNNTFVWKEGSKDDKVR